MTSVLRVDWHFCVVGSRRSATAHVCRGGRAAFPIVIVASPYGKHLAALAFRRAKGPWDGSPRNMPHPFTAFTGEFWVEGFHFGVGAALYCCEQQVRREQQHGRHYLTRRVVGLLVNSCS